MKDLRFEEFASVIAGLHWNIQKLKARHAKTLGIKIVHIFWVYLLHCHPEGLTASELAQAGRSTRSLVSREIKELEEMGYITTDKVTPNRRYSWKFILTESGKKKAEEISSLALNVQNEVSDIPKEDLQVFYRTLDRLLRKFDEVVEKE